jgi:threonine dehydrogenase-like Zn-dependent dehydrogenase
MYAVHLAQKVKGKKIGILGSGPIGISVMLAAKAAGCETIYMTDKLNERLSLARMMGATWTGNPSDADIVEEIRSKEPLNLDIIFECCGQQEAVDQAVKLLCPGGKLLVVGIPTFDRWSFDVDDLRRKELSIQNVRRQNEMAEATIELIANGRISPGKMQTHNFGFEEIAEAFELVDGYRDGVMKAMIHF